MEAFAIAELPVAAGWLGICPLPGGRGDLPGDLQAIHAWAPDIVVSMTTFHEMAGAPEGLAADLAKNGIAWRHFPVSDYGVPSEAEGALWPLLAEELKNWLERGGRVLLHCRGGCGRSGMVALRLMAELGEPPGAALMRLRVARPCAVETGEQQAWAEEGL